jgi:hypothetical protein
MNIQLTRAYGDDQHTMGMLYIGQKPVCVTIERPWKDNEPFISCIPPGIYPVRPYSSAKYPDTYEICDVPGRDKILFHVANFVSDLQGCVGPGTSIGSMVDDGNLVPSVKSSGLAMKVFKKKMERLFEAHSEQYIYVNGPNNES